MSSQYTECLYHTSRVMSEESKQDAEHEFLKMANLKVELDIFEPITEAIRLWRRWKLENTGRDAANDTQLDNIFESVRVMSTVATVRTSLITYGKTNFTPLLFFTGTRFVRCGTKWIASKTSQKSISTAILSRSSWRVNTALNS